MKKVIRFSLAALLLGAAIAPTADAVPFTDRALWEAAVQTWTDVDESQIPTGYAPLPGDLLLPSGLTIAFGTTLTGAQVPDDWATWSGGNTPRVLFVPDMSVGALASGPLWSFGLEMEPNSLAEFTMTLDTGEIIQQTVNGVSGAAFFGWAGLPVVSFTMSTDDPAGFAFGRMVEGPGAPPPTGVPDGGNITLAAGLLWLGLIVIRSKCQRPSVGV